MNKKIFRSSLLTVFFVLIATIVLIMGILFDFFEKQIQTELANEAGFLVLFAWIMVLITSSAENITDIGMKSLFFLILSGLATGASWMCYFKALSMGDVNKVAPIDKSSTVLGILLAIVIFNETEHLLVKLAGTAILSVGIYMMIETEQTTGTDNNRWIVYAVLSAVFAALTSILAKIGITGIESNLATLVRTGVVLVMAWLIVFIKGKQLQVGTIDRKELSFICLSGITTGASWLCYYYAIQNGIVSVVVPIDKMSILVTVVFSYLVLEEKLTRKARIGLCMMVCGTLVMAIWA